MSKERKEIIQLNGLIILVVMALIADFMVVGFFYRWHNYQVFLETKVHSAEMTILLRQQHDLHETIIKLEGVKTWNETNYVRSLKP
jgi:hypothetical protein